MSGALLELTYEWNWEQFGTMTPKETALAMLEIYNAYALDSACEELVPTPYWDNTEDVGDEAPFETQEWYGYVTDPEASPSELTFVEDILIWAFTGFLAIGTGSLNVAVAFRTIAPRFVLAMRSDDFVEVIRVIIDGEEVARKSTSGTAGDILEMDIVGNPENDDHMMYIIRA